MTKSRFKIRDKTTGKFWNGDFRWSKMSNTGKEWSSREAAEHSVVQITRYADVYKISNIKDIAEKWEVVEIQYTPVEKGTSTFGEALYHSEVRRLLMKQNPQHEFTVGSFYDVMKRKGVIDTIEFILILKPEERTGYVDFERIKEARAQLRQLGVKTRTFREYNGMFGMMDRDQAMKARLTLDIVQSFDLKGPREEALKKYNR